ncbi:MAG: rhomboid family intramembrane serine protease [Polyangiaceae bacterium]|nr:rhomboid family intramembrane serine protease [Polyangiaceae bacterium]
MDRLLARLERTFLGRLAIEHLTWILVVGMGAAFILIYRRPEAAEVLQLDPSLVTRQPWRLVTYLFLPPSMSMLWVIFALYFFWITGSALEQTWGAFKFNVFYFIGALGTTIAAFLGGHAVGNFWLNTTVYFAFATLYPDFMISLFFIIPIRIKWLALVSAALIALSAIQGDNATRLAIAVAFANYFLFFGGHLLALARGQRLVLRQAARRAATSSGRPARAVTNAGRSCAICGAKQSEGADIRVCSCDKCGGKPRDLCLEHARHH